MKVTIPAALRSAGAVEAPKTVRAIEFTVPGPPVPKARARVVRRSGKVHSFTPDSTREYASRVRTVAMAAVARYQHRTGERWPVDAEHYHLSCWFYRVANRGDLDNYVKAIKDAMNPLRGIARSRTRIVWPDDSHVRSYGPMAMVVDRENPRAVVRIEVIEP